MPFALLVPQPLVRLNRFNGTYFVELPARPRVTL